MDVGGRGIFSIDWKDDMQRFQTVADFLSLKDRIISESHRFVYSRTNKG